MAIIRADIFSARFLGFISIMNKEAATTLTEKATAGKDYDPRSAASYFWFIMIN